MEAWKIRRIKIFYFFTTKTKISQGQFEPPLLFLIVQFTIWHDRSRKEIDCTAHTDKGKVAPVTHLTCHVSLKTSICMLLIFYLTVDEALIMWYAFLSIPIYSCLKFIPRCLIESFASLLMFRADKYFFPVGMFLVWLST